MKIVNDHQTRTSATSKWIIESAILIASQRTKNRLLKLKSLDDSSNSDVLSEHFKQVIIKSVNYKALNNFWIKNHSWNFVSKANQVQIKLNTSQTMKHAKVNSDWEQWKFAFRSELDAYIKNDIFTLKTFLSNQWILLTCWIIIIKQESKEEMIKYKAKWVCKEFHQKQKIDYNKIFASMIRIMIIKMLLALMIKYDYEVKQMNVIIIFLETHLKEEIWMQQSSRFKQKELNEIFLICCLNKILYEFKQASWKWYATLKIYLIFIDYQRV